jgi:hypothetical protein
MNFAKRLLMVSGAVSLAAIVGIILTPKASHAIVATFVQVVNAPSQPVPVANGVGADGQSLPVVNRDADNPARQPFAGECFLITPARPSNTTSSCEHGIPVPPGKRLVIEYVSVFNRLFSGKVGHVELEFQSVGNNLTADFIPVDTGLEPHGFLGFTNDEISLVSAPTRLYVDPGTEINCFSVATIGSTFDDLSGGACLLSGYLLTP